MAVLDKTLNCLERFQIFPDSGMAYAPHMPKIAGCLSIKEVLHAGVTSQELKLEGRRVRG